MIRAENLFKIYKTNKIEVTAINGVSVNINDGEFVSVVGKSGSGKSTLLHLLGGLDKPSSGQIFYDGNEITALKEKDLLLFRREHIGFVFQSFYLIPELNIKENVIYPSLLLKSSYDEQYFNEIIERLELSDRLEHLPSQLSGGQLQRTAIARALINKPNVLFCDEPTGNLDTVSAKNCIDALLTLHKQFNQTLIIVTHDMDIAKMADRALSITDGVMVV